MQPLEARRRLDGDWEVARRCPECQWRGSGTASAEAYADLDAAQRAARAGLAALLSRVERARRRDETDRVVQALRRAGFGPGPA